VVCGGVCIVRDDDDESNRDRPRASKHSISAAAAAAAPLRVLGRKKKGKFFLQNSK